jgi:hypothetical protein
LVGSGKGFAAAPLPDNRIFPRLACFRRSAISISYRHAPGIMVDFRGSIVSKRNKIQGVSTPRIHTPGTAADFLEGFIQGLNKMKPRPNSESLRRSRLDSYTTADNSVHTHQPTRTKRDEDVLHT